MGKQILNLLLLSLAFHQLKGEVSLDHGLSVEGDQNVQSGQEDQNVQSGQEDQDVQSPQNDQNGEAGKINSQSSGR